MWKWIVSWTSATTGFRCFIWWLGLFLVEMNPWIPKFGLNIPSLFLSLRLARLFSTGLAEPNWWDPAQFGVPLVVFTSSISRWPMNYLRWIQRQRCEVWLMTMFLCLTQNDGFWKGCFLWKSRHQVQSSSGHTCLVRAIWPWWSKLDQAPNWWVQRDSRQMNVISYKLYDIWIYMILI